LDPNIYRFNIGIEVEKRKGKFDMGWDKYRERDGPPLGLIGSLLIPGIP
jgi:hypothetical protein